MMYSPVEAIERILSGIGMLIYCLVYCLVAVCKWAARHAETLVNCIMIPAIAIAVVYFIVVVSWALI